MQDTQQPRAQFRQWTVTTVYRECGVITEITTQQVALYRGRCGLLALVDGALADLERAVRLLQNADRTEVVFERLEQAAA